MHASQESPPVVEPARRERNYLQLSCCISRSRIQRPTLCLFFQFWAGCLSSLLETTEPPLLLWRTATWRARYGECDKDWRPGSGSKLYYINPLGHVLPLWPSEEAPDRLSLGADKHNTNHKHTNFTKCKPMPNWNQNFACNWVCKPEVNFVQTKIEYTSVSDVAPVQRAKQCIRYHSHNIRIHIYIRIHMCMLGMCYRACYTISSMLVHNKHGMWHVTY